MFDFQNHDLCLSYIYNIYKMSFCKLLKVKYINLCGGEIYFYILVRTKLFILFFIHELLFQNEKNSNVILVTEVMVRVRLGACI